MLATPHRLSLGELAALPVLSQSGEEPLRIAVGLPKVAQPHQQFVGEGHLAILAALALDDAQHAALAVNVAGLDVNGLADAQTAVIHDGEHGPKAALVHRG